MTIDFMESHWSGVGLLDTKIQRYLEYAKTKGYEKERIKFRVLFIPFEFIGGRITVFYDSDEYTPIAYHLVCKVLYDLFNEIPFAYLKSDYKHIRRRLENSNIIVHDFDVDLEGQYLKDYRKLRNAILKSEVYTSWYLMLI